MAVYLCCLCQARVATKQAVAIFGKTEAIQRVPSRIKDLLGVRVVQSDGLPQHICMKCKRRLETLERAAEDLQEFRSIASNGYESCST